MSPHLQGRILNARDKPDWKGRGFVKTGASRRIWPFSNPGLRSVAVLCVLLLVWPDARTVAQDQQQQGQGNEQAARMPPEQLDSLLAPIALYPDPLLSQILVASTYPLEIVQADRWVQQNSALQGKALTEAAAKQSWDPSIQAMVLYPDVLKRMDDNISWTTDLGNAFLAQQSDVMDAVQRLRQKAEQSGKLQTTPQQTVTTKTEDNTKYIVIQPASPQVIYVPQYNPVVVYGPPPVIYPYPAIVYPPPPTGAIVAASVISFGAGLAVGAMMSGWHGWGGYGWGCGWGRNTNVVINNNFIRSNNFNRVNVTNNNAWVHNPTHRAGVPYRNQAVNNRYNGGARNYNNRPNVAQTQQRLNNPGQRNLGQANQNLRPTNQNLGQRNQNLNQNRGGAQNNLRNERNPGGGDRIGNRNAGGGNFGKNGHNAFGDANNGGTRARQNASRGASSFGGGGHNRGGGGRR
jgi:hypothetical protein